VISDSPHDSSVHPDDILPPGQEPDVAPEPSSSDDVHEAISHPTKVMRIATMVKSLLEEVRAAQLDEAGRLRLREIYDTSVRELSGALSTDLAAELARMSPPFGESVPSESELRIAQAQLVGWLEGLFHGIQASLFAQQAAAQIQQRQLPEAPSGDAPRAGTYL
jgi:hypothetical protein